MDPNRRDSRSFGLVLTGTWSVATSSLPAWMIVSSVYVNFETTASWIAASRLYARKPDVVSGTDVSEACRTTHEPRRWSDFLSGEKCSIESTSRSPTTMSAVPARIGATSSGIAPASYWLSASVLTITSAPSFRQAASPAWTPPASPLLFVRRMMWSTPCSRATSIVRSVEPSSMISHSTASKPSTSFGRSRKVTGRVSSSLRQGIWMMSFIARIRRYRVDTLAPAMARADRFAKAAFALLCIGSLVGFLVFPTYPNYDSYYSLLWGREVLDLQAPTFEGFRVPTEHPLAIVAGAALSLLGQLGDRVWVALIIASYLWLIAGVYRLGRTAFHPLVGMIAAALLLTRFDYAFLTARGYIDIPYMAMVVWAAALEARRPRSGAPVLVLLALAGLLRPEAWVLAALYWCWVAWRTSWGRRALYALLAAAGPLLWAATDYAVTGDALFSLHYT